MLHEALSISEESDSDSLNSEDPGTDILSACSQSLLNLPAGMGELALRGSGTNSGMSESAIASALAVSPAGGTYHPSSMELYLNKMRGGAGRLETGKAGIPDEGNPASAGAEDFGTQSVQKDGFSLKRLVEWIDNHALARSSHHCAMFVRRAMEAGGISTHDRPASGDAGDYGPFLLKHGARVVSLDSYRPLVGDTAVFEKTPDHPAGHIEIFDGERWVSDFIQKGFSPYRSLDSTPSFTIYRLS